LRTDDDLARARTLLSELIASPLFARFVGDPTEAVSKIVVPMSLTRIAQRLDSSQSHSTALSSSSSSSAMHAVDNEFGSATGAEDGLGGDGHTVPYYRSLQSIMRDISQVCVAISTRHAIGHRILSGFSDSPRLLMFIGMFLILLLCC
jgi:hypothetical protein